MRCLLLFMLTSTDTSCLRHGWGDNFKDMTNILQVHYHSQNNILSTAVNTEKYFGTNSIEILIEIAKR